MFAETVRAVLDPPVMLWNVLTVETTTRLSRWEKNAFNYRKVFLMEMFLLHSKF
jgi:hypothetical protein